MIYIGIIKNNSFFINQKPQKDDKIVVLARGI